MGWLMAKQHESFDIEHALNLIREAVRGYPKPAAYALADKGFTSRFEQLVACIISIRERDEVTKRVAPAFFQRARTPEQVCKLSTGEIEYLLRHVVFHNEKSRWIKETACCIVHEYGGTVSCDYKKLLAFKGVGPKCANVVLALACGQPAIIVDTHVHHLVNAWGYVHTSRPEQTLKALEAKLPKQYWTDFNLWLVPFAKFACTGENREKLDPETRALCPGNSSGKDSG